MDVKKMDPKVQLFLKAVYELTDKIPRDNTDSIRKIALRAYEDIEYTVNEVAQHDNTYAREAYHIRLLNESFRGEQSWLSGIASYIEIPEERHALLEWLKLAVYAEIEGKPSTLPFINEEMLEAIRERKSGTKNKTVRYIIQYL